MENNEILNNIKQSIKEIDSFGIDEKISIINEIKKYLHSVSPFNQEPVDCVLWVNGESVEANSYNPNSVAPPEMELLAQSIIEDGYTQPIVAWDKAQKYEVVDGFHRNRIGKENDIVRTRINGYLPIVAINSNKTEIGDRMSSTIRHNRARGTHNVELMSNIVSELVEMGKGDAWICKHLGMSADELLRLKQITGVAALFQNRDFSQSWEAESEFDDSEFFDEEQ